MSIFQETYKDSSLAPRSWDAYIGQEKAKERLRIAIDAAIERLEPLKHVLILGPAGFGKGHPHGTPILTPSGWVNIENLNVGDEVVGSDGLPTTLTGIFNRGVLDTYRVTFTDGSYVDCDPDHIWWAKTKKGQFKEYTLRQLLLLPLRENVTASGKTPSYKYSIPMVQPVAFDEKDLLIDPYILGVLLANGNLTQGVITTNDFNIIKKCEENAPDWMCFTEYTPNPARRWKINDLTTKNENKLLSSLRSLNLFGLKSREKFIPSEYLFGSISQRLDILQGLMDCDGSQVRNHTSYSSYSEHLAEGVSTLVKSLGGTAPVSKYWRDEDQSYEYRVAINLKDLAPFSSDLKLDPWLATVENPKSRKPYRKIASIDKLEKAEVICLRVEAEDSLYVTKDFIVTHNTSLAEIVAKESKTELLSLTMTPNYDMKKLFNRLKEFEGGTVFLDEIHCLSKKDQHFLLDLLEKKKLSYPNGKVEYLSIPLTIIGATTEPDLLIKPLYDRFPYRIMLQPYSELEMAKIVERMALQLDMHPIKEACLALGKASAGVPRQARTLVFTAQDIGSLEAIDDILETCGITREGLTEDHIAYLRSLYELGSKAGKANIVVHSGRPEKIILDLEKLLVLRNYVTITPSGRELTYDGMKVLKEALS